VELYHVNFKTLGRRPIFEQPEYDDLIRTCLPVILRQHGVICLAWELMPTHVHLLIADFLDYPRSLILQHVKGDTSRAFFRAFPRLREDLRGGHLWERGYYWAEVRGHYRLYSGQPASRRSPSTRPVAAKCRTTLAIPRPPSATAVTPSLPDDFTGDLLCTARACECVRKAGTGQLRLQMTDSRTPSATAVAPSLPGDRSPRPPAPGPSRVLRDRGRPVPTCGPRSPAPE